MSDLDVALKELKEAVALEEEAVLLSFEAKALMQELDRLYAAQQAKAEPVWIPVSELVPEDQIPVVGFNPEWIDEDSNPEGVRECFLGGDGWISAKWDSYQDTYENDETPPTHWQSMPAAPQQEQQI